MRDNSEGCLHAIFGRRASACADRRALISDGKSFSYADLERLSDVLAAKLQKRGVRHGHVVALLMNRSAEMIVAMLGVLKCGASYMPLDTASPAKRNRYCLDQARCKLIITDRTCSELCEGERTPYRFTMVDLWGRPDLPFRSNLSDETAAYVLFTSGTTAEPKGVVVPHRAVTRLVLDTNYITISPEDRILQHSTPSFDASTFEIWGALLNGATLVLYTSPVLDPNLLERHIRDDGITLMWLTAAVFHLLVQDRIDALRPLKVLLAGGDVLRPDVVRTALEQIDGLTLINGYGPTENTTFTCCHVMTRANPPEDTVPIGRPITGTEVFILDDDRRPVVPGRIGELYTAGRGVALGYLNSGVSEDSFLYDGRLARGLVYRTGDLVRCNEEGLIEFIGRVDSQVKLRGYRVSLEEIRASLTEIPEVKEAIVSCQKQPGGDQLLIAYLQTREHQQLDAQAVRDYLGERVPRYMIPDRISIGTTLPINSNGKVDRRAILSTLT
jgi:amino acid adenylation domain-containing protein